MAGLGLLRKFAHASLALVLASCSGAEPELERVDERALLALLIEAYWDHDFTIAIVDPFIKEHVEAEFGGYGDSLRAFPPKEWGRRPGTLERLLDSNPPLRTSRGVAVFSSRRGRNELSVEEARPLYIAVGCFRVDGDGGVRVLVWYLGPDGHRSHTYVYTFQRNPNGTWEIVDGDRAA